MSIEASRLRRVRLAIYGPIVTAILGVVLLVSGVLGVTQAQLSTADAPPPVSVMVPAPSR